MILVYFGILLRLTWWVLRAHNLRLGQRRRRRRGLLAPAGSGAERQRYHVQQLLDQLGGWRAYHRRVLDPVWEARRGLYGRTANVHPGCWLGPAYAVRADE